MNLVSVEQLLGKLKGKKNWLVIGGVIAVVALILFSGYGKETKDSDNSAAQSIKFSNSDSTAEVEQKLENVLSKIKGVGKVQAMVTYETGPEIVPVFQTDKEVNTVREEGDRNRESEDTREKSEPATVQTGGTEEALVLKEKNPEIRGVIVIAQGAEDAKIRMQINQAVMTVLHITAERVNVFEMD
jgi:stage III sporulation protein AG